MTEIPNIKDLNADIVDEFRSNGGKVGGPFEGGNLLLLHTTGAKSGQPRLSPLAYFGVDDRIYVVGSFAGADKDPAWVQNMRAHPQVHIEIGATDYDATARELPREERDALYPKLVEVAPVFAKYQAKTSRVIPVFELARS
ncbi:nitroreductase family deazaflavin-dependent oxidoreductase [Mycolicibacterium novocastrense]|uniref:Deazaflavin-dependent nitroreductase family protein n=1 Tax=Mycolicibacterium novocastrense TaxID=59813 RepID=A0AAW5SK41_MYCNV|nr:nitroreductase family deazaflavin-dependent oxidoreductase [Mycolicibacterium novocastrense]MCV7024062.1 nitroreductase family deazaflavin-dependent oxidoreductase [Mycolicibacterium novocastrense]GAT09666.1 deazaflavin-dependent nitroreductase family protein [Mycolicibacterium novocastrense]